VFDPDLVVVVLGRGAVLRVLAPGGPEVSPDATQTLSAGDLQSLGVRVVQPDELAPEITAKCPSSVASSLRYECPISR
jgi:hypothetical protein